MKLYSYNRELKFSLAQFVDIFNNITIYRYNQATYARESSIFPVRCVKGNRTRILKSLENKDATMVLPIMCVMLNGYKIANNRVHDPHYALNFSSRNGLYNPKLNLGVPVDINFSLSVISGYEEDHDQIIQNFVVNFNPDIFVTWPNPFGTGNMRSQVIFDGSVDIKGDEDTNQQLPTRITSDLNFTFKSWLFPGTWIDNPINGILGNNITSINPGYIPTPLGTEFLEYQTRITNNLVDLDKNIDQIPVIQNQCWFYDQNPPFSPINFSTLFEYEDGNIITTEDGLQIQFEL